MLLFFDNSRAKNETSYRSCLPLTVITVLPPLLHLTEVCNGCHSLILSLSHKLAYLFVHLVLFFLQFSLYFYSFVFPTNLGSR